MKNISFVVYNIGVLGGAEQVAVNIANELCKIYKVEIYSICGDNSKVPYQIDEKIKIQYGKNSDKLRIRQLIKNNFIDFSLSTAYDKETRWTIPGAADYQVENAALAILAMRILQQQYPSAFSGDSFEQQLHSGMKAAFWPGRMQEIAPEIYFDGAHNTSGIGMFTEAVKRLTAADSYRPLLLFSMVKEKDYSTSIDMLTSDIVWDEMAVTTIPNERGISFEKLQKLFEYKLKEQAMEQTSDDISEKTVNPKTGCRSDAEHPIIGFADYREALRVMKNKKKPGQKLFCTGSLYFIGALMEAWKENCDD